MKTKTITNNGRKGKVSLKKQGVMNFHDTFVISKDAEINTYSNPDNFNFS